MLITQDIIDDFKMYMPDFADISDALLGILLEEASEETGDRWGSYDTSLLRRRGMFNYVAHKLSLRAMGAGGVSGTMPDAVSSKSVADESVSYAVATPSVEDTIRYGDLRMTSYGIEFLRLRKRIIGPMIV